MGWRDPQRIRSWFDRQGLHIQAWDKVRTDFLTIRESPPDGLIEAARMSMI